MPERTYGIWLCPHCGDHAEAEPGEECEVCLKGVIQHIEVVPVVALLAALPDGVTRGQVRAVLADALNGYKAAGGTTTCPACEHERVWGSPPREVKARRAT